MIRCPWEIIPGSGNPWESMGEDFKATLPFRDYCQLKQNEKGRYSGGLSIESLELQHTIGRMYFPTYDGSAKCTARAWVEKLDTYFQLNQMTEVEAIKIATLHLKGEAHDLSTLGRASVVSYEDFTREEWWSVLIGGTRRLTSGS